jgi:hypothetical protein
MKHQQREKHVEEQNLEMRDMKRFKDEEKLRFVLVKKVDKISLYQPDKYKI